MRTPGHPLPPGTGKTDGSALGNRLAALGSLTFVLGGLWIGGQGLHGLLGQGGGNDEIIEVAVGLIFALQVDAVRESTSRPPTPL